MTQDEENLMSQMDILIRQRDELGAALGVLLDSVDFTRGACTRTDMVGACIPPDVLEQAQLASDSYRHPAPTAGPKAARAITPLK